jgi:hypothetical protein
VTTPEFERKALEIMQQIRGSSAHVVEVTDTLVSARCIIGGDAYELSFSAGAGVRDQAFASVLRGVEATRERFANG